MPVRRLLNPSVHICQLVGMLMYIHPLPIDWYDSDASSLDSGTDGLKLACGGTVTVTNCLYGTHTPVAASPFLSARQTINLVLVAMPSEKKKAVGSWYQNRCNELNASESAMHLSTTQSLGRPDIRAH